MAGKSHPAWNKGMKFGPNPIHSARMKGRTPWNKGTKGVMKAWNKGKHTGIKPWLGKKRNHMTSELRYKISEASKRRVMDGTHNFWKGGKMKENDRIRGSIEMKLWRKAVFERDKFTCIWCGQIGGELNADHIKPFAHYPELRFAIDNGRTLCVPCHKTTDTYLLKSRYKKYE